MKILNIVKEEIKSQILKEQEEGDDYPGRRGELRRKNKEWEGDKLRYDVQGQEATALLQHMIDEYDIPEDEIDVYNMIPVDEYHYMTAFEVDHPEVDGMTFIVGDEDDTYKSAVEVEVELLDDIGIDNLPYYLIEANIDRNHLKRDVDSMVSNMIWESPEDWIDDEPKKNLSYRQQTQVEFLYTLISKYDNEIRELEKTLGGDEDELTKKMIDKYLKLMEKQEDAVRDIENSPEGDYPEQVIEGYIKDMVDDLLYDTRTLSNDYGIDLKKYVDMQGVARDIVDIDGVERVIRTYDGKLYEYKVLDKYYSVGRFD